MNPDPSTRATSIVDAVRRMHWLTRRRASAYRLILVAVSAGLLLGAVATARHGMDLAGKPLGTDFLAFWSASRAALAGHAADAYDLAHIGAAERGSMPADPGVYGFLYPPPFLLLCLPLALLPYLASLAAWLAATGLAYGLAVRRWLTAEPGAGRGAVPTILGFPAVLTNIGHGQNGFLTAALLGGGLWLLDRRPWIAGMLLGALVIKPQIALAIPVLVVAGGRRRVAAAGVATMLAGCALSWLVLGPGAWAGFAAGSRIGRDILEHGLVEPGKMVSVFAAVRVLGGGATWAYAAQAVVALAAAFVLALMARRRDVRSSGQAALCAAACALMSPFLLDYDLTMLAIPLAWLFGEGVRRGFLPWEKAVLAAGYLLPLLARNVALALGVAIAPFVTIGLFAACVRAVHRTAAATPEE